MKLRKRSATLSSPKTIVPPLTPAYIASGIFKNGQWVMDAPEFESAVISVLDCRSRIDALKATLDSAEAKIVELSEQVSGDTEQDLEINGYGFDVKINAATNIDGIHNGCRKYLGTMTPYPPTSKNNYPLTGKRMSVWIKRQRMCCALPSTS